MKHSKLLDRILDRLDRLDSSSVQGYILRLARERGLLETIFQTIHEGIILIDRKLHVHFANRAAIELLGLPADIAERENAPIHRYLRELNWTELLSQNPEEWERASRQEIEVFYPEHRYLQFYLLPYRDDFATDDDESLSMVAMILQDVTRQHESTDSVIQEERINAITLLAAGVAHEIGNPLNSLTIHLQLLERYFRKHQDRDEERVNAEMVDIALEEVRRLDKIINQFLTTIRPVALDLQPVSLNAVLNDTLSVMQPEIENRGVYVKTQWPEAVPEIMGDENQLKQAFYNIILNALQAMPHGGTLQIQLIPRDEWVNIQIRDTGEGIEPENLANIFDPYYTSKSGGTGLGLMIVQRIFREHGAELGIESKKGEGTLFSVKFPRRNRRIRLLEQDHPQTVTLEAVSTAAETEILAEPDTANDKPRAQGHASP